MATIFGPIPLVVLVPSCEVIEVFAKGFPMIPLVMLTTILSRRSVLLPACDKSVAARAKESGCSMEVHRTSAAQLLVDGFEVVPLSISQYQGVTPQMTWRLCRCHTNGGTACHLTLPGLFRARGVMGMVNPGG